MSAKRKAPQCRAMELQNRQINRADQSLVQYNKYRSFLQDLGFLELIEALSVDEIERVFVLGHMGARVLGTLPVTRVKEILSTDYDELERLSIYLETVSLPFDTSVVTVPEATFQLEELVRFGAVPANEKELTYLLCMCFRFARIEEHLVAAIFRPDYTFAPVSEALLNAIIAEAYRVFAVGSVPTVRSFIHYEAESLKRSEGNR